MRSKGEAFWDGCFTVIAMLIAVAVFALWFFGVAP